MSVAAGAASIATAFGALAFVGMQVGRKACAGFVPFADGPRRGAPPVWLLVVGFAMLGAALAVRGEDPARLAVSAIACVSLAACWYADAVYGIIPDIFTLVPLAVVIAGGILRHEWWPPIAALILIAPFAILASASKGRGMGWGDAKLAALGGALLGTGVALFAFAAASLVAAGVAWARGRRAEPIAFAPYMVASICAGLFLGAPR